jgi:hypothetical protein
VHDEFGASRASAWLLAGTSRPVQNAWPTLIIHRLGSSAESGSSRLKRSILHLCDLKCPESENEHIEKPEFKKGCTPGGEGQIWNERGVDQRYNLKQKTPKCYPEWQNQDFCPIFENFHVF